MAQIYAALTYYYENQREFDAQIAATQRSSAELLDQIADQHFRRRLIEWKRTR